MSAAAEMRSLQSQVLARKDNEDRLRRVQEAKDQAAKRAKVEAQAQELFAPILEDIRKAATSGQSNYNYHFSRYGDDEIMKAQVIGIEAEKQGFTAIFKQEDHDMGDFAAPCHTTLYWLEIRWDR